MMGMKHSQVSPHLNRVEYSKKDYLEWRYASGPTVEVTDIEVRTRRRDGIGRAMLYSMMRSLPKEVRLVWAITRIENLVAQQFYEGCGFRVIAVLRRFYRDTHDDLADAVMFGRDRNSVEEAAEPPQPGGEAGEGS